MSCTIKCNSCNIVIDELLSYIQNKISIADEETLVKICASTFSIEQIKKSKELLFESVPTDQRKTIRKGKGKENRVLIDIISFFKVTDPDLLPVFVARDLEKLPPILFDHLDTSKLLKDLALVRSEVDIIKSSYVSIDQLEAVKRDLLKNQYALPPFSPANINIKRGAYQDSGPIGLTNIDESAIRCYENEINVPNIDSPRFKSLNKISVDGSNQITMSKGPLVRPVSDESHNSKDCQLSDGDKTTQNKSYAIVTKSKAKPNPNEGWKLVQKKGRKRRNYIEGKTGSVVVDAEEKFRAAERHTPLFITNVHKNTSESDITTYIHKKTQETVKLERISIQRQCEYNAYKFFVLQSKVPLFLDESLWPKGIIFRRFINFKVSRNRNNGSVIKIQNG
ncbi:unnamed protein product [Euphydryas editha]|uniref:Mutant cadherin n=1 Tax=Euphydryas editha TaxID=104508 RepID=A0AAU9V5P4_EUPED|nr:unnamed protein product [Euphydryas editha]